MVIEGDTRSLDNGPNTAAAVLCRHPHFSKIGTHENSGDAVLNPQTRRSHLPLQIGEL